MSALGGRHALVTGGGRGIGAAIVSALAAAGARITLAGRDGAALNAHAATLPASAGALAVACDVTDDASVAAAFEAARARHGEIAILVNNAGASLSAPFVTLEREAWDAMLAVNLTSAYTCARAALPAMVAAQWGRIVNVASTAGLVGGAYIAAYSAAKHGVVGLTRSLAVEFARKGITVNAVCPGFTATAMLERAVDRISATTGRTPDAAADALLARNPLKRFVRPDEVADAVVWLCGENASAVNGQAIAIDGGEVQP